MPAIMSARLLTMNSRVFGYTPLAATVLMCPLPLSLIPLPSSLCPTTDTVPAPFLAARPQSPATPHAAAHTCWRPPDRSHGQIRSTPAAPASAARDPEYALPDIRVRR